MLDGIDRARDAAWAGAPPDATERARGRLLCHFPARSGGSGRAELASKGFFDALDRPPLALWLEALGRPHPRRRGEFEPAVLVFVPAERIASARAGCSACPDATLAFLGDCSPTLASQLDPLVDDGERA